MSPRGRPRKDKECKRRAVKIRLAQRMNAGKVTEPYQIMEEIIATDRKDLVAVKIGIAWHTGWRPDADNVRTHGKCQKRSDLDRSLDTYDAIIILSETSWLAFTGSDKVRLITHELEHIQLASDKNGEPLIDDKGRQVIRMKRHDVADFASIIQKFGLPPCLSDVQIADADRPLFKLAEEKVGSPTTATNVPEGGPEHGKHTAFECKFKGLRGCKCHVEILGRPDGWRAGYSAKLGNFAGSYGRAAQVLPVPMRSTAIEGVLRAIIFWLDSIVVTGTGDAKRSLTARRDLMKEQITDQINNLIGDSVPFAEDPEPGSNESDEEDDDEVDSDEP